jgi:hypothetical protein
MTHISLRTPASVAPFAPRTVTDAGLGAMAGTRSSTAGGRLVGVIVFAITFGIGAAVLPNWPAGVFQDDGIYVVLGKALAGGEGYRYLNLPGAPYATHYPPGYPLFLALLWKLSPSFPENVAVFVFANVAFLALAAVATYAFGRSRLRLTTLGAAVTALATVAAVPPLIFGVFVMSEPMFMAAVLLVLLAAERAADRGHWPDGLLVGFAGGALAMIRSPGMFVVAALVLVLTVRRRFLAAVCAALGGAVFLVPWKLWVAAHGADVPAVFLGKYGPYDTWLGNAIRTHGAPFVMDVVARNAKALYDLLWTMFAGGPEAPAPLRFPAVLVALLFLTLGASRLVRRAPVTGWFLAAYLALVMIWPFEPTRFVWVLLPLFGLMLALGFQVVAEFRPRAAAAGVLRVAAFAPFALLLIGYAVYNANGARQRWWDTVPRTVATRATPVVQWVRTNTKPTDLIAVDDDVLVYLYTGRTAIPIGTFTPEEYVTGQSFEFATIQLDSILAQYKPAYVIGTTSYGVMAARSLLYRNPPELRVRELLKTAAIFTIIPR